MRIISSFVDFYDCIQRVAQDRTLVYIRNPEVKEFKYATGGWREPDLSYSSIHIAFCGKNYLCAHFHYKDKSAYCYNVEAVDRFVNENCPQSEIDKYFTGKNYRWYGNSSTRNAVAERFIKVNSEPNNDCSFHCPIVITYCEGGIKYIVKNGKLKDFQFYRLFDPVMAFQELSMYLGGLAAPQERIPEMSNADKINARGFDKYSFRKGKSK